jgi:TM2 domain-containing membrane protein YozV
LAFVYLAGIATGSFGTLIVLLILFTIQRLTIHRIEDYCDALIESAGEPTEPPKPKSRALS